MNEFDNRPLAMINDAPYTGGVAWAEGLQLMPQHFQLTDSHHANMLFRGMFALDDYFWGLHSLRLNTVALNQGIIQVNSVSGIFPCGLIFDMTEGQIEDYDMNSNEKIFTHFALKLEVKKSLTYYNLFECEINQSKNFADVYDQEQSISVGLRVPKISIINYDINTKDPYCIPFMEVLSFAPLAYNRDFHPPSRKLIKDSPLYDLISKLLEQVKSQITNLRIEPYPEVIQRDYSNGLTIFANSLVPKYARITGAIMSNTISLPEIYNSILELIFSILSFSEAVPNNIPIYNHSNPYITFSNIFNIITPHLGKYSSNKSSWKKISPLSKENYWTYRLEDNKNPLVLTFVVRFDSVTYGLLLSWIEKVLICWESDYARCREARVKGFTRSIQKNSSYPMDDISNTNVITFQVQLEWQTNVQHNSCLIIERPSARLGLVVNSVDLIMEVL